MTIRQQEVVHLPTHVYDTAACKVLVGWHDKYQRRPPEKNHFPTSQALTMTPHPKRSGFDSVSTLFHAEAQPVAFHPQQTTVG